VEPQSNGMHFIDWKINMEINYFVEQPDAFGPEWFIGFNVTPVVENALANWF